jgi:hypothetical protein
MTQLQSGQTVTGTFDGTNHGILINTYTFTAAKGDTVLMRALARGYNPAQLTIVVKGPMPSTNQVASANATLTLRITVAGTYTVELSY